MANEHVITIQLPPREKKEAVAGTEEKSSGSAESSSSVSVQDVMRKAKRMVALSAAVPIADTIISNKINTISLRTGAVEYEQRQNATYSAVKQAVGAGIGLAMGAMINPAGLAVAAIGVVTSGIVKLINIEQKQRVIDMQANVEGISIGMAINRAGTGGRRSSNQ